MLSACKALQVILVYETGAQDLFVRRNGIRLLKECSKDYNSEIKKAALKLLSYIFTVSGQQAKTEAKECGLLDEALSLIRAFPKVDPDPETLIISTDILV